MIRSLKFLTLSLISTLSFMSFANANKVWVNIVNLDIPDEIKGVRKVFSKEVYFHGEHKTELPVPEIYEKHLTQSIDAGSYSMIGVEVKTRSAGGEMAMSHNCYFDEKKPLHLSADKYTQEEPLGIAVTYDENTDTVNCDITTPY